MIPSIRKKYNDQFTKKNTRHILNDLNNAHPDAILFRVAETPVFCDKDFTKQMISACESIVDVILSPAF